MDDRALAELHRLAQEQAVLLRRLMGPSARDDLFARDRTRLRIKEIEQRRAELFQIEGHAE
jgi:hypothetical protein